MDKTAAAIGAQGKRSPVKKASLADVGREIWRKRVMFLMLVPTLAYFIIFHYLPMPGAYVAFVDFKMNKGIFGSTFIGLKNFEFLVKTGDLWNITRNTLLYNLAFLVLTNITQIVFALMLSEVSSKAFKRTAQSVILLPHFISMVIVGFFVYNMFNYDFGFINTILVSLGLERQEFYATTWIWKYVIIFFKLWASTGYGMIIYLATITGISQDIYEAAYIDGASYWQRIRYVTLPLLMPTFILLFLFALGGILQGSYDLFYNIIGDNSVLYKQTDIIDTYVVRSLIGNFNFSMGEEVGFYQSIFGLVLVTIVNAVVKKVEPDVALF